MTVQAKSRCGKKCTALKTQHIIGDRSGAGKDQHLNVQIKTSTDGKDDFCDLCLVLQFVCLFSKKGFTSRRGVHTLWGMEL